MFSCSDKIDATSGSDFKSVEIKLENDTSTVDIEKYVLISSPDEGRKSDAAEILELKRKWPLVMQSPKPEAFDSILSKNFTFADSGKLFNRADYIANRCKPSDWKITFVKYENLTLQFFGDLAVLSYRNHVTNENAVTKEIEIEHIDWTDVYVRENGKWKIASAHVVNISVEPRS